MTTDSVSTFFTVLQQAREDLVRCSGARLGAAVGQRDGAVAPGPGRVAAFVESVCDALRSREAKVPAEAAKEHGRQRAAEGFTPAEVVREFALLVEEVFQVAGRGAAPLTASDVLLVTSTLSRCEVLAVEAFEAHRPFHREAEQLRVSLDALPFLVSYVTAEERYGFVNRAYESWFGLSAEALRGRTLREIIGDDAYAVLGPLVRRGLAGEPVEIERYGVPYRAGGTRDVKVRFFPDVDHGGTVHGYVALLEDVTERRKTELVLGRVETRLHVALRAGGMGTWDLDLATWNLVCSDTCKTNYGRDPGAPFTYEDLAASVLDEDRPGWRAKVEEAIRSCSDLDIEYRTRWPDGSVHWVNVRFSCIVNDEGQVGSLSGVSINIDERKRIEEELRAADRRKDEFLSTASHELRTPLNAILGWASLLRGGRLDEEARRRAGETIERNARSQVKLIEDILDGSRVISGKLRLEVAELDFAQL